MAEHRAKIVDFVSSVFFCIGKPRERQLRMSSELALYPHILSSFENVVYSVCKLSDLLEGSGFAFRSCTCSSSLQIIWEHIFEGSLLERLRIPASFIMTAVKRGCNSLRWQTFLFCYLLRIGDWLPLGRHPRCWNISAKSASNLIKKCLFIAIRLPPW